MHDDTIKIVKYTSKIHVSNNVNHHCSWGTNAPGFLLNLHPHEYTVYIQAFV